jgi:23S rRNA (uracil1939-C5)-methyltransferase
MNEADKPTYLAGDLLDVRVEKIVPGGHGLAFAENLTIFVDLAAVGDILRVRLRDVKGKIAFADIESVVEPAASRIEPPCPYVGRCGGCDFQQMTYSAQLAAKVGIIRDCLHRIGKLDYDKIAIVPSPQELGYRLRAEWHFERVSRQIGYYARNSRDLVPIEHCPILSPKLDSVLQDLRSGIEWETVEAERGSVDAAVANGDEGSLYSRQLDVETRDIGITLAGEKYRFSAGVFFQANLSLIERLIHIALSGASGEMAFDLYCGVGLFTLPLARRFKRVVAVEEFGPAAEYARTNANEAGLHNIKIVERLVGRFLAEQQTADVDFALLDPPRSGTEKKTVLDLIRIRPKQVAYVSCDPSVLARDLRRFLDGGYVIVSITALDLFPQTHHVETVVRLRAETRP